MSAIRDAVLPLGLELRAGLHTGEVEVVEADVRDLVAGSPIESEDRGTHDLRGVADDWHLYALASA